MLGETSETKLILRHKTWSKCVFKPVNLHFVFTKCPGEMHDTIRVAFHCQKKKKKKSNLSILIFAKVL